MSRRADRRPPLFVLVLAIAGGTLACNSSSRECQDEVNGEGAGKLRFSSSSPSFEPINGYWRREVSLSNYTTGLSNGIEFGSLFDASFDASTGFLMFHAPPPWRLSRKVGPRVSVEVVNSLSECTMTGGEPRPIVETVLREISGELLVLGAISVPTLPDGSIPLAAETLLEVKKVEWIDVGCSRSLKDRMEDRRVVALRLSMQDGLFVDAAPGERAEVTHNGKTYVFAPGAAFRSSDAENCGYAGFVFYRQGILVDADEPP